MSFNEDLKSYIAASYSALYVTTHEEARLCDEIYATFGGSGKQKIFEWDSLNGLYEKLEGAKNSTIKDTIDPIQMCNYVSELCRTGREDHIYILKDFHLQFDNPLKKIAVIRAFKTAAFYLRAVGSIFICISPVVKIPIELTKEIQLMDYALPIEAEIDEQIEFIKRAVNDDKKEKDKKVLPANIKEEAIEAAKGMTSTEVENAFSLAIVKNKEFNPGFVKTVFKEKIQQVKKNGLLTYVETNITFDNVGGLDVVKAWIITRKDGFSKRARTYGLPYPKGIGLAGIAGCGKTLISKAIANVLGFPLFQLDLGKLFSKYVGETEQNFHEMIKTIESIGRCVIQLDEVEKYLNTGAVSGQGDSGTSSRSFGSVLTWLSERDNPAFVVATSNNHLILPVELVRKGRFDEWFWIDLPEAKERETIFDVVIRKYNRDPKNFIIPMLAKAADKFTGAEIDNVFKDAMFRAFAEEQEVNIEHVMAEIDQVTPQAIVNEDKITAMREQVDGRLRLASSYSNVVTPTRTRKVKT